MNHPLQNLRNSPTPLKNALPAIAATTSNTGSDSKPKPEPASGKRSLPRQCPHPTAESVDDYVIRMALILYATEGWAFFAWHRKRWPGPSFMDHLPFDRFSIRHCQRAEPSGRHICRLIWEEPDER